MKMSDQQLEALLHEFEPREPRPLPLPASDARWRRRLLAAAVVILAGSVPLWLASHRTIQTKPSAAEIAPAPPPAAAPASPNLSLLALTHLAQNDPQKLEANLDADSRRILPGFQGKGSTLAALAKE